MSSQDVIIIGAGVTGLVAARTLQEAGVSVRILDKASRPGGRLSTRRVAGSGIDSGVCHFDVSDPGVLDVLTSLAGPHLKATEQPKGWRLVWEGEALEVAAAMAAGMSVETALVTHVRGTSSGIGCGLWGAQTLVAAGAVILTVPVPQARLLLERSGIPRAATLDTVDYEPRLVLLAALDGEPSIDHDRATSFDTVDVIERQGRWLLRAQLSAELSQQRWDHDATHTLAELLFDAADWIEHAVVTHADCMRWRYAIASTVCTDSTSIAVQGLPLVIGGDGFGIEARPEASVERACRSGLDMAAQILG